MFVQYFLPVIIPAVLIIGNEWIKERVHHCYQRKKYKKWKEIYNATLSKDPSYAVVKIETDDIIYELIRDMMLKLDEGGRLTVVEGLDVVVDRLRPRFP